MCFFRCFGSFKKQLRRTRVSSLYQIAEVCGNSKCNFPVLVGDHNKDVNVITYDWTSYFEKELKFKTLDDILPYQHFRMTKDEPGVVSCLMSLDDEPVKMSIFRMRDPPEVSSKLPAVVEPKGFTIKRAEYLRKEIRPFCTHGTEDLVAP